MKRVYFTEAKRSRSYGVTTLREDLAKENPDKQKVGKLTSKLLDKISKHVKIDPNKVKDLMTKVTPEMKDPEVRNLFVDFVKDFEGINSNEVVDTMMKVYLLNKKSGKKTAEAIVIALGIGIKFISDNSGIESKDKTSLNEIVARSIKMNFWKFIKWMLIIVISGIIISILISIESKMAEMVAIRRARALLKLCGSILICLGVVSGGLTSALGQGFYAMAGGMLPVAWILG